MSVLEIAEPESYILIIVLEVIGTLAVLLVLQPLSFVSLAIRESIYAISAALSLDVGTLVSITILIMVDPLPCGLPLTISPLYWPPSRVMQLPSEIFCADMARGEQASIIASIICLPVSKNVLTEKYLIELFFLSFMSFIIILISKRTGITAIPGPPDCVSRSEFDRFRTDIFDSIPKSNAFSANCQID